MLSALLARRAAVPVGPSSIAYHCVGSTAAAAAAADADDDGRRCDSVYLNVSASDRYSSTVFVRHQYVDHSLTH